VDARSQPNHATGGGGGGLVCRLPVAAAELPDWIPDWIALFPDPHRLERPYWRMQNDVMQLFTSIIRLDVSYLDAKNARHLGGARTHPSRAAGWQQRRDGTGLPPSGGWA
jgi:hypothetical protein